MKIIKFLTVISIFTFVLYGCSSKSNTQNNTNNSSNITVTVSPTTTTNDTNKNSNTGSGLYKDGTYTNVHKSTKPGYEEADVTIQNGTIQNINLKRLDDSKVEVNYDAWNGTGEYPNLKKYRLDLAKAMLAKQSPDVDAISGATESSNGWKAAVTDALAQAKK